MQPQYCDCGHRHNCITLQFVVWFPILKNWPQQDALDLHQAITNSILSYKHTKISHHNTRHNNRNIHKHNNCSHDRNHNLKHLLFPIL